MRIPLNDRWVDILLLLETEDNYITSKEISKRMGVTSRTVRDDIKKLKDCLREFPLEILSKKRYGYKLIIQCKEEWEQFKKNLKQVGSVLDTNPVTPEDRQRYIVKRLIDSNDCIKLENLMEELYVSESTIKNDLKNVKSILQKYNIRVLKCNKGLFAEGHEINKRFCISDYLIYRNAIDENLIADFLSGMGKNFSNADFKKVKNIILQILNSEKMVVTDDVLIKIATHILISLYRVRCGKFMDIPEENLEKLKKEHEYKLSERIIESIEQEFQLKLPEDETAYATLHLLGNRLGKKNEGLPPDLIDFLGEDIFQLSLEITRKIGEKFQWLELEKDEILIYGLGLHLKELLTRLTYQMNIRNPYLKNIKIKYPLAFEAGVIAAKVVESKTGFQIGEHEIGFLALHIGAALERLPNHFKYENKKVALVCASGMATSELLLTKLSQVMDSKYYLIGTYPLYQLDELMKQKPDIILTTVPIEEELSVPVIQVPAILDDRDIPEIKQSLESAEKKNREFSQFLREDLFFSSLQTKTKTETIEYLTKAMLEKGYITEKTKASIIEREQISATAIGNMVAIPHPIEAHANHSVVSVGILDQKIQWAPNEEVSLVFVIVLEEKLRPKFQAIFSTLYDIVYSSENVEKLCNQKTFDKFRATIESL